MKERHLYRGKAVGRNKGQWRTGSLVEYDRGFPEIVNGISNDKSGHCSVSNDVDPDTVGQCTGLKDKNGVLIFEGDIVSDAWDTSYSCDYMGVIEWVGEKKPFNTCAFEVTLYAKALVNSYTRLISSNENGRLVVIGNIHDNPQMMSEWLAKKGKK